MAHVPGHKRLDELFPWPHNQRLLNDLRKMTATLEARFAPLESRDLAYEEAIQTLQNNALERIDTVLAPTLASIQELTTKGFLTAHSNSNLSLVPTPEVIFSIPDAAERAVFQPTAFMTLSRVSTPDDYGIGRLISWDRSTGTLRVEILTATGSMGPHSDWEIGAAPGVAQSALEIAALRALILDDYATKADTYTRSQLYTKTEADAKFARDGAVFNVTADSRRVEGYQAFQVVTFMNDGSGLYRVDNAVAGAWNRATKDFTFIPKGPDSRLWLDVSAFIQTIANGAGDSGVYTQLQYFRNNTWNNFGPVHQVSSYGQVGGFGSMVGTPSHAVIATADTRNAATDVWTIRLAMASVFGGQSMINHSTHLAMMEFL